MVTNVCAKFNYYRLNSDKVLGNWKSDNKNKPRRRKTRTTFAALWEPFRVRKHW